MGYFIFGAFMTSQRVLLSFLLCACIGGATLGQTLAPADSSKDNTQQDKAVPTPGQKAAAAAPDAAKSRADAYYNFTMGHIYEQQYESTSKPEYATQAIDAYKK